jgi:hypothetical protein
VSETSRQAPKAKSINLDRKQLRSLRSRKSDLQNSERQLDALADSTNGTAVNPETFDEMIAKTALIAKMIDASYAVTYIPKFRLLTERHPSAISRSHPDDPV